MNNVLKSYANSVAGATVSDWEALNFLEGLGSYEIRSSVSNQGERTKNLFTYSRKAQVIPDAKRCNRFFASVTAYSRPRGKATT